VGNYSNPGVYMGEFDQRDRCRECGTSLVGSPEVVKKLCGRCAHARGQVLGRLVFKALREMSEVGGPLLKMEITANAERHAGHIEGYLRAYPSGAGAVEVESTLLLDTDMMQLDDGSQVQEAIDDMGATRQLSDIIHDTQYHPAVRKVLKDRRKDPPEEVVKLMQEVALNMESRTDALLERLSRAAEKENDNEP